MKIQLFPLWNILLRMAISLAEEEYEKYRKKQDKNYISDFDREVKRILENKKAFNRKTKSKELK